MSDRRRERLGAGRVREIRGSATQGPDYGWAPFCLPLPLPFPLPFLIVSLPWALPFLLLVPAPWATRGAAAAFLELPTASGAFVAGAGSASFTGVPTVADAGAARAGEAGLVCGVGRAFVVGLGRLEVRASGVGVEEWVTTDAGA